MNNIGQLIMTGIAGTSLAEDEKKFIEENNIGGVLLFSRNYESPAQLAELINTIQVLRTEYPLLIATDHEGGRVQRFKEPFTQFPSAKEVARSDSPKLCYSLAQVMSQELLACGVNTNFAPVCDILTNSSNTVIGDRAYGKNDEDVSKFVSATIRGFQTNGMISCAKHFPGHGDTKKDSHLTLPIVKTSLETLRNREFLPFIKAVKSRVDMVMMAHLMVDVIDPDLPCTLSPKAYEILRKELRFQKVIITDDMQMGAITETYGTQDAAVRAIAAGADMLEYKDLEQAQIAYEALQEASKKKVIKNVEFKEKFERVQELKKQYLSEYRPVYIPDISKNMGKHAGSDLLELLSKEIERFEKIKS